MAQLFAVGGAALGSFTGIGGSAGWLIGGIVGNILFPPDPIVTEGPRLGDLTVTSSAYGAPRQLGFGTIRQAGNIIWSSGIREQKNTREIGGKGGLGGPAMEANTYTYFSSFALAFGEGPADDVLRIWAEGKLIFDKRSTEIQTTKAGLTFRFYKGTLTQLADPSIVADKGIENTPAFRNTVYILFDDLPLSDFGNRIPNITAEITYDGTSARFQHTSSPLTTATLTPSNNFFGVDWDRGYAYYGTSGSAITDSGINRVNLNTQVHDREYLARDMFDQTLVTHLASTGDMSVAPDGALIVGVAESGASNGDPIARLDPYTLKETARFGVTSSALTFLETSWRADRSHAYISAYGLNGREDFLLAMTNTSNSYGLLSLPDMSFLYSSTEFIPVTDSRTLAVCGGIKGEGFGDGYIMTGPNFGISSDDTNLLRLQVAAGSFFEVVSGDNTALGVDRDVLRAFTPSDWIPGGADMRQVGPMMYDEADDTIIIYVEGGTVLTRHLVKYDPNLDTIVWRTVDLGSTANVTEQWTASRLQGTTFGYIIGNNGVQINTVTGEVLFDNETPNWAIGEDGFGTGAYDSQTESFIGLVLDVNDQPMIRYFFNRGDGLGAGIDKIIESIAGRVNLQVTDLDVTDLAGNSIPGYFIGRQSTARAAIEPLSNLFFFDGVESDFKLKFVERGNAPIRTIPENDLATIDTSSGEFFRENRVQEVELPERFTMVYMDKDNDYVQQAHSAKRILLPTPAMRSDNQMGLNINAALTTDFAKQQAEKALYSAWVERVNLETRLSWEHLDLDPADVVNITTDSGISFRSRLTQLDVGDGFIIDVNSISEQTSQFDSTVVSDGGTGVPVTKVPTSAFAKAVLLDVPLLRDADEPPSRVFNPIYFFMGGVSDGQFTRGSLFKSADNIAFDDVGTIVSDMSWGASVNALGDPPSNNPFATDFTNTLTVVMNAGSADVVSVTNLQMLNGANPAALIKTNGEIEVIQFQNVTLNPDGSFTLDTLLRGRRGTDSQTNDHTVGELFVLLISADGDKFPLTLAERNVARFYRSVGSQQLFEEGEQLALTSQHNALKPYAPVNVTATEDGSNNIDFAWERRTRVGGELQDGTPTVPLAEDTEEYEIDIFDGLGVAATGTLTFTGQPSNNERIILDGKTYFFQTTLTNGDGNILIGATTSDSIDNAVAAITLGAGAGTLYALATTLHPTTTAVNGGSTTLVATAKEIGPAGNSITTTEIIFNATWGAATLLGGADPAIVQTATGLTTPAFEYLNADIVTDFGSVPATITVQVFQISAQVGRGFTRQVTIPVL